MQNIVFSYGWNLNYKESISTNLLKNTITTITSLSAINKSLIYSTIPAVLAKLCSLYDELRSAGVLRV